MTILKQVPISHYPDKQGKQTASPLNAVTWTKDMNSTLDEHFYPFCFSFAWCKDGWRQHYYRITQNSI